MIFISHNYKDKPIVEQIALRLRDIFGQDRVFYDSWSIQPGDGIIDRMNQGIGDCKLFLFFVSKNRLQSKMVSLEWQNAVIKATKGQSKLIPVKLDECLMPPILWQSLYVDLFGQGLEIALRQIIDIASGKNTFQAGTQQFSNLRAYRQDKDGEITIECHAEHYLEPISNYALLTNNVKEEIKFMCIGENQYSSGFHVDGMKTDDGLAHNMIFLSVARGTLPGFPLIIKLLPIENNKIDITHVMHEYKKGKWQSMPLINGEKD